jgi:hypothetical protein
MTKQTFDQIQIDLPADVLIKARGRARALGMTISEYMQSLVDKDVATKEHDPWRQPVPPEVAQRWSRELAEFEEEDKTNPRPGAKTGAELIKLLDEEAATLPDDEGD